VTARPGDHVIQINPEPTPLDEVATVNLTGPAAEILPGGRHLARPFGRLLTYGRGSEDSVAPAYGDRAGAAGHASGSHSRGYLFLVVRPQPGQAWSR
jgi:hypothetical protein